VSTFVALGSNLGDRLAHLQGALDSLQSLGRVLAVSAVYDTAPMYVLDQPPFLNAVARIETNLDPDTLMDELLGIERAFGRRRDVPGGPRTLDLDLLDCDGQLVQSSSLVLPHPRLTERPFVVFPLRDVDPDWHHPGTGVAIGDLAAGLKVPDRFEGQLRIPSRDE
jgi:2-amino-4-hydroxy-6-hydroxymethyldihydropteridine diphosphokinase